MIDLIEYRPRVFKYDHLETYEKLNTATLFAAFVDVYI